MVMTRMICRCCGHKNGPDIDTCFHCGEEMYEIEEDEWEEDWEEEEDWNEGDAWYNEKDGGDGESAYTGFTADSMKMPWIKLVWDFKMIGIPLTKQRMTSRR